MVLFSLFLLSGLFVFIQSLFPLQAFAAWTPLLTSADFTGIETDVGVAVAGIVSISLIILGATMLMGALRGR